MLYLCEAQTMARLREDPPEVIALCLACQHDDCDGGELCPERLALMRRLAGKRRKKHSAPRKKPSCKSGPRACMHVTFEGETLPLSEWARRAGVGYQALYGRIVRRRGDAADVLKELLRR